MRCTECRRLHRQCNAHPDSGNGASRKCTECERKGVDCVPSIRVPKGLKTRARRDTRQRIYQPPPTPADSVGSPAERSRPWNTPDSQDILVTEQYLSMSNKWTQNGLTVLQALSALLTTQVLLQHVLTTVKDFEGRPWARRQQCNSQRVIADALQWTNNEFAELATLASNTPSSSQALTTLRLLQRLSWTNSPQNVGVIHRNNLVENDYPGNGLDVWLAGLNQLPDECDILYSTTFISITHGLHTDVDPTPLTGLPRHTQTARAYTMASSRVQMILERIQCDLSVSLPGNQLAQPLLHVTFHRTFPASNIAFLNHARDTAKQLWLASPSRYDDVDVLGRTYLHLLVEARDNNMLEKLAASHPDSVKTEIMDVRGLSLLGTAVFHGMWSVFSLLLGLRAYSEPKQKIFELALYTGNSLIMESVLGKNFVQPPWPKAVATAIELGHLPMVEGAFWRYLKVKSWHPPEQIEALAKKAEVCKHQDLALKLRKIEHLVVTITDAKMDLDNAEFCAS